MKFALLGLNKQLFSNNLCKTSLTCTPCSFMSQGTNEMSSKQTKTNLFNKSRCSWDQKTLLKTGTQSDPDWYKSSFPFVCLPYPNQVVSVPEVQLGENHRFVGGRRQSQLRVVNTCFFIVKSFKPQKSMQGQTDFVLKEEPCTDWRGWGANETCCQGLPNVDLYGLLRVGLDCTMPLLVVGCQRAGQWHNCMGSVGARSGLYL